MTDKPKIFTHSITEEDCRERMKESLDELREVSDKVEYVPIPEDEWTESILRKWPVPTEEAKSVPLEQGMIEKTFESIENRGMDVPSSAELICKAYHWTDSIRPTTGTIHKHSTYWSLAKCPNCKESVGEVKKDLYFCKKCRRMIKEKDVR